MECSADNGGVAGVYNDMTLNVTIRISVSMVSGEGEMGSLKESSKK